ncbi:MAG TPA: DUF2381 family protein [Myxococcaceae bacterium]|nr:DUF2381 family protein [Myxococcaceae bacterium]
MALLLCGLAAEAQPVARVRREQQLLLAEQPSLTELELRVARGVPTLVRVDEDVKIIEVKHAELGDQVWVDVASHSLQLEPLRPLAPGERLPLELLLQQGSTRTRLVLLLVSHPNEVDTHVSLELRPRSARQAPAPESPPPDSSEEDSPPPAVRTEEVELTGVTDPSLITVLGTGVTAKHAQHYRAGADRFIVFRVYNPEGARPWSASEVVRLSPTGVALPGSSGWTVSRKATIAPGSSGLVMLKAPPGEPIAPVRLEVREQGGSRGVRLEERN